jgi:hypothetical protein
MFVCKPLCVHITGKFNFKLIDWYTTENVSHRGKEGHVKKLVRRGLGKTKMDVKVGCLVVQLKRKCPSFWTSHF